MTQPDTAHDTAALVTLAQAIENVRAEIASQTNLQEAFTKAQRAALMIRMAADEMARTRAVIGVRLVDGEGTTLTVLGHMIGVSKPRAGQIVDHGRRILTEQNPAAQ